MIVLAGILLPIVAGLLIPVLKLNNQARNVYVVASALASSVLAFYIAFASGFTTFTLLHLNRIFSIGFKIDGLSKVFLLIIATLWPIATLYATEYMAHEENQDSFFRYYLIAFGIAIGLAFSKNAITMYLFYELLTFLTLPLIMHDFYEKAGRREAACLAACFGLKERELARADAKAATSPMVKEIDSLMQVYADLDVSGELALCKYRILKGAEDVKPGQLVDFIAMAQKRWANWSR